MSSLEKLKEKLSERKIIPFVGAGVSMSVKDNNGNDLFPSWGNLLLDAAEKLKDKGKEPEAKLVEGYLGKFPPNYLKAAEEAREGLGSEWYDFLKEAFDKDFDLIDEKSLEISKAIWNLGSELLITTNYDKVLYWSCPDKNNIDQWNIEATYEQVQLIKNQAVKNPTIWYLHGHIGNVRSIILTPDGYQNLYPADNNAKIKYEAALTTLRNLFISHTFLFIGFSLDDEYLVNQLRYVQDIFQGTLNNHFILIRESDKSKLSGLNLGIEPITFESFGDEMLKKLYELKDEPQEEHHKTATEKYNPKNRVIYIPFYKKGEQVVGREENLKNVRKTLLQGLPTNIGQAVSIQGLGGLGKTQLAVEYAYEYEKKYPNGVIWLTVDQDIDKQLVEVCDKAGWVAPLSEIKVKLDVARNRLKTITDCLIILDNVEIFDRQIRDYLPVHQKNIHILATTRNILFGFKPIPLKLLTPEQAIRMLEQESHRKITSENERKTVKKIAEEVGFLPLALEHIGGFLHYLPKYNWGKFLSFLRANPRKAFERKFLEASFTEHEIDIYRTLKVSEDILNEEPLLRDVLDLLTWSGTSPMSVDLMCHLLDKKDYELEIVLSLGETLRLLQKSPKRNAYAIHRLVAEVRKEEIPLAERIEWIDNVCQLLGDWFQAIKDDFTKLPEYEAELEHLAKWQVCAENFATENASRLLWLQGYPPFYRGKYKEAKEIVRKAIEIYKRTNCKNLKILAHLYNDFGNVSGDLGEYQTNFDNCEKSLEIRLGLFGENHLDTAISYNNLGRAYRNLGKYQEGFENFKKSLEIRLELFGEQRLYIATSYNNLGLIYGNLGKYREQYENLKKSLDIYLESFGEKHPSTATSYNNLGLAYGKLGKYKKQYESLKKSLDIRLELFGEKHPDTANSFHNVSNYYEDLENYEAATEYAKKSLILHREMFGNLHPHTLNSVQNLVDIYTKDNKSNMALNLVDEFLQLVPKSYSEHKKLENQKRWILEQAQKEDFR